MEIILIIVVVAICIAYVKGKNNANKKPADEKKRAQSQTNVYDSDSGRNKPESASSDSAQTKPTSTRRAEKTAKWYGINQKVNIQGYDLAGGLIYVGERLSDEWGSNDACLINPKLKISRVEPGDDGDDMDYYPRYGSISSKCRGAYLQWLQDGCARPEANIGYVFLFFYGLERRLLIDGQEGVGSVNERFQIVEEINRLLGIYGENRSFRGYANSLLAMEWMLYQQGKSIPGYLDPNHWHYSDVINFALATYAAEGIVIPANVAIQWLVSHASLRTPALRCTDEFELLFTEKYEKEFENGLILKQRKTRLQIGYSAANPSLGYLQFEFPDLPTPVIPEKVAEKLCSMAEECTVVLDPYSRYIGRKGNVPDSVVGMGLLPKKIICQSPALKECRRDFTRICANGTGEISMKDLYEIMGKKTPSQITRKESESLAVLMEKLDFGIAPDIRYHNAKPSPDGKVAIFAGGHGADFCPSKEYKIIIAILILGVMVSRIHGGYSRAEESVLQKLINDNSILTQVEKVSLLAFLRWCIRTPQKAANINKNLGDVSSVEKNAISRILISVALADGRIEPEEINLLEKLYHTLGLNKEQVASDIHILAATDEPVTVARRDVQESFSIGKSEIGGGQPKGFNLNDELIRIRTEETRKVKGILENIFEQEEITPESIAPVLQEGTISALDQAHQTLFDKLVQKETWNRAELDKLCKNCGLMTEGAIEVLNEWAFENADAPLIEDGDPVFIDLNIGREIANG